MQINILSRWSKMCLLWGWLVKPEVDWEIKLTNLDNILKDISVVNRFSTLDQEGYYKKCSSLPTLDTFKFCQSCLSNDWITRWIAAFFTFFPNFESGWGSTISSLFRDLSSHLSPFSKFIENFPKQTINRFILWAFYWCPESYLI